MRCLLSCFAGATEHRGGERAKEQAGVASKRDAAHGDGSQHKPASKVDWTLLVAKLAADSEGRWWDALQHSAAAFPAVRGLCDHASIFLLAGTGAAALASAGERLPGVRFGHLLFPGSSTFGTAHAALISTESSDALEQATSDAFTANNVIGDLTSLAQAVTDAHAGPVPVVFRTSSPAAAAAAAAARAACLVDSDGAPNPFRLQLAWYSQDASQQGKGHAPLVPGRRHYVAVAIPGGKAPLGMLVLSAAGPSPPEAWQPDALRPLALMLAPLLRPQQVPIARHALAELHGATTINGLVHCMAAAAAEVVAAAVRVEGVAVRVALMREDGSAAAVFTTTEGPHGTNRADGALPSMRSVYGTVRRSQELMLDSTVGSTCGGGLRAPDGAACSPPPALQNLRDIVGAPLPTRGSGVAGDRRATLVPSSTGTGTAGTGTAGTAGVAQGPCHGQSLPLPHTLLCEAVSRAQAAGGTGGLCISDCNSYVQDSKAVPRDLMLFRGASAPQSLALATSCHGGRPLLALYATYGSILPQALLQAVVQELGQLLRAVTPVAAALLQPMGPMAGEWRYLHDELLCGRGRTSINRSTTTAQLVPTNSAGSPAPAMPVMAAAAAAPGTAPAIATAPATPTPAVAPAPEGPCTPPPAAAADASLCAAAAAVGGAAGVGAAAAAPAAATADGADGLEAGGGNYPLAAAMGSFLRRVNQGLTPVGPPSRRSPPPPPLPVLAATAAAAAAPVDPLLVAMDAAAAALTVGGTATTTTTITENDNAVRLAAFVDGGAGVPTALRHTTVSGVGSNRGAGNSGIGGGGGGGGGASCITGRASFSLEAACSPRGGLRLAPLISSLHERLKSAQAEQLTAASRLQDLDSLRFLECVGKGGYGSVYRGLYHGAEVAIKVVEDRAALQPGAPGGGTQLRAKHLHDAIELVASASMSHPNIVQLITHFVDVRATVNPPLPPSSTRAPAVCHARAGGAAGAGAEARAAAAAGADAATCDEDAGSDDDFPTSLDDEDDDRASPPPVHLVHMAWSEVDSMDDSVLDAANGNEAIVLVMEYCDRGSLQDAIQEGAFVRAPPYARASNGQLSLLPCHNGSTNNSSSGAVSGPTGSAGSVRPVPQISMRAVYTTLLEIALALRHMHGLHIVHCDLKPQNVLLKSSPRDPRGFTAKLSDFGLAKMMAHDEDGHLAIAEGIQSGTITHLPPEALQGRRPLGPAVDVFAFGVCMWQLLCGMVMYRGMEVRKVIRGVVRHSLRPVFPDWVPAEYRNLAQRCWHDDPGRRPSALQLVAELECLLGALPCSGDGTPGIGSRRGGAFGGGGAGGAAGRRRKPPLKCATDTAINGNRNQKPPPQPLYEQQQAAAAGAAPGGSLLPPQAAAAGAGGDGAASRHGMRHANTRPGSYLGALPHYQNLYQPLLAGSAVQRGQVAVLAAATAATTAAAAAAASTTVVHPMTLPLSPPQQLQPLVRENTLHYKQQILLQLAARQQQLQGSGPALMAAAAVAAAAPTAAGPSSATPAAGEC